MYWSFVASFLLMASGAAVEQHQLRRGGRPHPRGWLALCWLSFTLVGVGVAMVLAWDDAVSWAALVCFSGSFVAAAETRRSTVRAAVLIALKANPAGIYGLDLWKASRVAPGSLYPLLFRLEKQGLVRSWWSEQPEDGSYRRRYYALIEEAAWRS